MTFNRPIQIQVWSETSEAWSDYCKAHASVNKHGSNEYLGSGAEQSAQDKEFTVRYNVLIRQIEFNTQIYRILYDGYYYEINDYDDYMDSHRVVKLLGTARGVASA